MINNTKCSSKYCKNEADSGGICKRCAEGYTKAFYKIASEQFGIRVKGVRYIDK